MTLNHSIIYSLYYSKLIPLCDCLILSINLPFIFTSLSFTVCHFPSTMHVAKATPSNLHQSIPRCIPIELPTASSLSSLALNQISSNTTNIPLSSIRLIYRGKIISSLNAEGNNIIDQFQLENGRTANCNG